MLRIVNVNANIRAYRAWCQIHAVWRHELPHTESAVLVTAGKACFELDFITPTHSTSLLLLRVTRWWIMWNALHIHGLQMKTAIFWYKIAQTKCILPRENLYINATKPRELYKKLGSWPKNYAFFHWHSALLWNMAGQMTFGGKIALKQWIGVAQKYCIRDYIQCLWPRPTK